MQRIKEYGAVALTALFLSCVAYGGEIHDAVLNGDISLAKDLITADTSLINAANEQAMTPLRLAVYIGDIEIVKMLLDRGAKTDDVHPMFGSIMNQAFAATCQNSKGPELVELLIANGLAFDANQVDALNMSPLDWAVHFGNAKMAALVLDHGADANLSSKRLGRPPLIGAVSKGNGEIVNMLLGHGADVSIVDENGNPAVFYAVDQGRTSILEALFARGAAVDFKEPHYDRSLLHLAAIKGFRDIVEILVSRGADIDAVERSGKTPIFYAVKYANHAVADFLITNDADQPQDFAMRTGRPTGTNDDVETGAAAIRYLSHRGWLAETKNHMLVFDAEEFGVRRPDNPSLKNGFLTAGELARKNVIALYSCYHGQPGEPAYIHTLADSLNNLAYVHLVDDAWRGSPNSIYLKGRADTSIAGLSVQTIDIADYMPMLAYMCHIDGLTIYYQAFGTDNSDSLFLRYGFLRQFADTIDIAFLPMPEPEQKKPDIQIFLERFPTRSVVLIDDNHRDYLFPDVARRVASWGFSTKVLCAENPGDRFDY